MTTPVELLAGSKFVVHNFDEDDNVISRTVYEVRKSVTLELPEGTIAEPVLTINEGKYNG